MNNPRYHGRAAFDPEIVAAIAAVLQSQWDADGALLRAAAATVSEDHTLPRAYHDFAGDCRLRMSAYIGRIKNTTPSPAS